MSKEDTCPDCGQEHDKDWPAKREMLYRMLVEPGYDNVVEAMQSMVAEVIEDATQGDFTPEDASKVCIALFTVSLQLSSLDEDEFLQTLIHFTEDLVDEMGVEKVKKLALANLLRSSASMN